MWCGVIVFMCTSDSDVSQINMLSLMLDTELKLSENTPYFGGKMNKLEKCWRVFTSGVHKPEDVVAGILQ